MQGANGSMAKAKVRGDYWYHVCTKICHLSPVTHNSVTCTYVIHPPTIVTRHSTMSSFSLSPITVPSVTCHSTFCHLSLHLLSPVTPPSVTPPSVTPPSVTCHSTFCHLSLRLLSPHSVTHVHVTCPPPDDKKLLSKFKKLMTGNTSDTTTFGVPLEACPLSETYPFVPKVMDLCITEIEQRGLQCEGLYRCVGWG